MEQFAANSVDLREFSPTNGSCASDRQLLVFWQFKKEKRMKILEISEVAPACHSNVKLVETADVAPTCHNNVKLVESAETAPTCH